MLDGSTITSVEISAGLDELVSDDRRRDGRLREQAGELTRHGVTRTISLPLHAVLAGDVVTVTGSIDIAFADYAIEKPTSFLVLSIEGHGIMELQLHFRRG